MTRIRTPLRLVRSLMLAAGSAAALGCAAAAFAATPPMAPSVAPPHQAQLGRTVVPTRYTIAVAPDATALSFTGTVSIALDVAAPTRVITLNALDLQIGKVGLSGVAGAPAITSDAALQTMSFTFATPIAAGRHTLEIAYTGKINQSSQGLFALDYDTPKGKQRMLVTQFEAADARRFVPSFDEPDLKAVFDITVTAPTGQMVVSNMPVVKATTLPGGLTATHFAPSPKMSSYLMYFGVGDLERIHQLVDGVDVGVIVRRGAAGQGRFALDAAAHILRYYNDYFGIRFPLPKLDLIGGPGAGGFGAMENWGAIFYFENDLLVNPDIATDADRQNVYLVVAHEMAHQWFGDLVTMGWWDDLWLNEGFASWMENKATDAIHPEWKTWLQFAAGREAAYATDALGSTHPVVEPANTIEEVSRIGDAITYEKGASVIRMIEAYAGADPFRAGIRTYLAAHAYGNATTAELLRSVQAASGKPVVEIGEDFIRREGVPLIRLGGAPAAPSLTQGRFALDAASRAPQTWHVPVIVAPLDAPAAAPDAAATQRVVVTGATPVPLKPAGAAPLIVNAGQTGYFRTLYAPAALAPLAARFAQVPAADQLGLLADGWALATSGDADPAGFLALTQALPIDADPTVWLRLAATFGSIDRIYAPGATRDAFRAFARDRLASEFAAIGFDAKPGESDNVGVLRNRLIGALAHDGDAGVIAEVRRRFARLIADPRSANGPTRRAIIGAAAEGADQKTFDQLRALARATTDALEKQQLDSALVTAADPAIQAQGLALTLTDEVPVTVSPRMLYAAAGANAEQSWTFATAHREFFQSRLDSLQRYTLFASIASASADAARADQLQAFADKYIPASARRDVLKAEDMIRTRARLRVQVLPAVDRWIAAHPAAR